VMRRRQHNPVSTISSSQQQHNFFTHTSPIAFLIDDAYSANGSTEPSSQLIK
jgi:hypothetical protein